MSEGPQKSMTFVEKSSFANLPTEHVQHNNFLPVVNFVT